MDLRLCNTQQGYSPRGRNCTSYRSSHFVPLNLVGTRCCGSGPSRGSAVPGSWLALAEHVDARLNLNARECHHRFFTSCSTRNKKERPHRLMPVDDSPSPRGRRLGRARGRHYYFTQLKRKCGKRNLAAAGIQVDFPVWRRYLSSRQSNQ